MSLLKVLRYNLKPDWTLGKLLVLDKQEGFTIEDEIRGIKVKGETAVPYGKYLLGYRQSPKFSSSFLYSPSLNVLIEPKEQRLYPTVKDFKPHNLIWIKDIPNFEYVLLHWGNTDDDTEGCLIVGSSIGVIKGQEAVLGSKVFYKQLYPKIYPSIEKGEQYIEYIKQ